jgi:hypothetical protein
MRKNMAKTWLGRGVMVAAVAAAVAVSVPPVTASAEVLRFYYGDWKNTFEEADSDQSAIQKCLDAGGAVAESYVGESDVNTYRAVADCQPK